GWVPLLTCGTQPNPGYQDRPLRVSSYRSKGSNPIPLKFLGKGSPGACWYSKSSHKVVRKSGMGMQD
ncbi:hypothetical protein AVEN_133428-1, partial [Araneus ventricosus]